MKLGRLKKFVFYGVPDYELRTIDDFGIFHSEAISAQAIPLPLGGVFVMKSRTVVRLIYRNTFYDFIVSHNNCVIHTELEGGSFPVSRRMESYINLGLRREQESVISRLFSIYEDTYSQTACINNNSTDYKFNMEIHRYNGFGEYVTSIIANGCFISQIGSGTDGCNVTIIPDLLTYNYDEQQSNQRGFQHAQTLS